ncbi:MAG: hypothetical protein ACUVRK_10020 [Spirochaetota bacterium]
MGQYAILGQSDSDGKQSVTKMAIVGREQGGFILESYTVSEKDEDIMQMLVVGLEKVATSGNVDDLEILWIKVKD